MKKNKTILQRISNCNRSSSPVSNRPPPPPAKRLQLEQQEQEPQQQPPVQSTSTNNTKETPEETMDIDPTPSNINKGKTPETQLPPVTTVHDDDQANDASENMLSKDIDKKVIRFEREQETPIFFAYCAAETFLPGKSNRDKTNAACDLFCGTEYLSFIGASVRNSPSDPTKKIVRIGFTTRGDAEKAIALKLPNMDNTTFLPLTQTPIGKFNPEKSITITEIPISVTDTNIRAVFSFFGKIIRCSMTTKNLWQQATVTYDDTTDMSKLDNIDSYFVLKDLVRIHRCTLTNDAIRAKSKFSLKLTNLPIDTNGRQLINIGRTVNAMAWVIPKAKSNYRNLQYAVFYFKTQERLDFVKECDTFYLDQKKLIWTDPNTKLCYICSVPGHQSYNCRRNRKAPKDRQMQNLYQRYQPAQFSNYKAPPSKPKSTPIQSHKQTTHRSMGSNNYQQPKESYANNVKKSDPNDPSNYHRPNQRKTTNNKGEQTLNASIHATENWADSTEYEYFQPNHPNNDTHDIPKLDQIMLKLELITNQLATIHNDLSFTIERVNAIEENLGITALTQKDADELNASPAMKDDDYEDPVPYKAGIISDYTEVDRLRDENDILKENLELNVTKLNFAL